MSFSREELQRVARLAALDLSEEDSERLVGQLTEILEYCRQVQSVDQGDDPFDGAGDAAPLREDAVRPADPLIDIAAMAPVTEAGLIIVPRVEGLGEP